MKDKNKKKDQPAQYLRAVTDGKVDDNGLMWFTASTEGTKRDGLSLAAEDWRTANFERNPVFLWNHNMEVAHDSTPIGRAAKVEFKGQDMRAGIEFDSEDEFAMKIRGKYERGFLNAVSVRWLPIREDGFRGAKSTIVNDLLEISATPVPVDPEALLDGRSVDLLEDADVAELNENFVNIRTIALQRNAGPLNHDTLYQRVAESIRNMYGEIEMDWYTRPRAYVSAVLDDYAVIYDVEKARYYKHSYNTDNDGNVTVEPDSTEVIASWTEVNLSNDAARSLGARLTPKTFETLRRAFEEQMLSPGDEQPEEVVEFKPTVTVTARGVGALLMPPVDQKSKHYVDPNALMRALDLKDPV